jgi:hypothetical protein
MKGHLGVSSLYFLTTMILTAVEYSFVVPHDTETLIDLMGGRETFEARLDLMVLFPIPT